MRQAQPALSYITLANTALGDLQQHGRRGCHEWVRGRCHLRAAWRYLQQAQERG